MAVRTDARLLDAPMQPVRCSTCGACVEVRKSSWDQTSIQWDAEAVQACLERRADSRRPGPNGRFFSGCAALREDICQATVRGDIRIELED